jgi:hypothetical protein
MSFILKINTNFKICFLQKKILKYSAALELRHGIIL